MMDDDAAHPPMGRKRRHRRGSGAVLALVGLLATIGLLAAACGAGSDHPGVASGEVTTTVGSPTTSGGASTTPASTAGPPTTNAGTSGASTTTGSGSGDPASNEAARQAQELQLAQCMRSHGVPNFPDPGTTGGLIQAIARAGIDANSPSYHAALQACRQYTGVGNMTPAQRAADNAKGVEFSQCMRSHGVPNFPDPTTGPTGAPAINLGPEHIDPSSPAFQAANQACERMVPGTK
ncbi:MAG: hypothetical protein FWC87_11895 [Acidimicrobiaceae bacterium]|nr:hypothetical protein [Acidimicrobiaceae bacterium]